MSKLDRGTPIYFDELWEKINYRNEITHIQDGMFIWDIKNFEEEVVREAILNAICHRNYRLPGSVFVKQYPKKILIESPGGFPVGVTQENICFVHVPVNRKIAEVFQKIGFVERSGQGADKMFRTNIVQGKGFPDYSSTDDYHVRLTLYGTVQDVEFIKFLEKVAKEKQLSCSLEDLLLLEEIRIDKRVSASTRLTRLKEAGTVEFIGHGKGTRYILSRKYYEFTKSPASYTKRKGLDEETNKALILTHLTHHKKGRIGEFEEVLPALKRSQIKRLLSKLKQTGKIKFTGTKRKGYWEKIQKFS